MSRPVLQVVAASTLPARGIAVTRRIERQAEAMLEELQRLTGVLCTLRAA